MEADQARRKLYSGARPDRLAGADAEDILDGRKHDPRFYPVVYGLPDDADWQDEQDWYKCNPSLGYTITIDKVRDAYHKALETPADENMFRQLRLNQWVKQSIRWMPMDKWDECGGVVDPYQLEGRVCYAGLDLSSTSDLTTLVLVFPPRDENEPYMVLPFFWLPEDTLALRVRRDHVMYDQWERQGFIQTTEGNVVHYGFIEKFICEMGERYNIREIAYDRWNATMMVQALEDDGFTMPCTQRINPFLPLKDVNRVNNLMSLDAACYRLVNNPSADYSHMSPKAQRKITELRKKLRHT